MTALLKITKRGRDVPMAKKLIFDRGKENHPFSATSTT